MKVVGRGTVATGGAGESKSLKEEKKLQAFLKPDAKQKIIG